MNNCKESRMPIDTSPEGAELLHKPVVWPFPQSTTAAASKHHAPVDVNDDGHNHEGEPRDSQAEAQDSEQGLAHGALNEQAVAKPPLGN
jgi:hypothetical protein